MRNWILVFLTVTGLMLAACAGDQGGDQKADLPDPETVGDPVEGHKIFNEGHNDAPACSTCHTVDGSPSPVGPSLEHIASRAGSQVEGLAAVDYLHQSIVDPGAYIANDKKQTVMYQDFGEQLTDDQINDLIAYLLTLK